MNQSFENLDLFQRPKPKHFKKIKITCPDVLVPSPIGFLLIQFALLILTIFNGGQLVILLKFEDLHKCKEPKTAIKRDSGFFGQIEFLKRLFNL